MILRIFTPQNTVAKTATLLQVKKMISIDIF